MKKFTAVIVDDEANSLQALKNKIISHCPQVVIIGECSSGEEGIAMIEDNQPDIVFLDVEMPRMNGFVMLKQLAYKNFALIFTTAYNHYAVEAIRASALDYLVKPVEIEELKNAVERVVAKKNDRRGNSLVENLLYNFLQENTGVKRIAVPSADGLQFVDCDAIVYLEASSNYTLLHTVERKKITVAHTLKDFEEMLPANIFIRIHHSYIINKNFVSSYIKGEGGQVVMKSGTTLDVARRKKDELLKTFDKLN